MIKTILGKKVGMTRVFTEQGESVPVTAIKAGPCVVMQVKNDETDGYKALQLGFDDKREKSCNKSEKGHAKKANAQPQRILREVEWDGTDQIKQGDKVTVDIFENIRNVDVTGIIKGRGFTGVVKKWGFHGGPATHGQSDRERAPGSLGRQHSISQGVYPGKKMAGHWGVERVTIKNLQVTKILKNENVLLVRGAVPGPNDGYVMVRTSARQKKSAAEQLQAQSKKGKK